MASLLTKTVPWHEGEEKVQRLLQVPERDNPTTPYLSPGAGFLVQQAPLLALGTLDSEGRPWSTIWGGTEGFAAPVAESSIGLRTQIDTKYDPVAQTLLGNWDDQHDNYLGKMVSGLAIDLEHRKRVKLYGRMESGSMSHTDPGQAQLVVHIEESMGNCPKYLNKKHIVPAKPDPILISDLPQLIPAAVELLARADTMFVSSSRGTINMDTNIRGGPPGFVRVQSNESSGAVLVYPEYSGNRLYQTLGNLQNHTTGWLCCAGFRERECALPDRSHRVAGWQSSFHCASKVQSRYTGHRRCRTLRPKWAGVPWHTWRIISV